MFLHYVKRGQGPVIVFLHGMAVSARYWERYLDDLSETNTVLALDLLGFGRSPQSSKGYTYDTQIDAIRKTLKDAKVDGPMIVVGHSMGALIALRFAALYPAEVSKLVLLGLPVFKSQQEAIRVITRRKKHLKLSYFGPSARALCTVWCKWLRPISRLVAPFYIKNLPRRVAADTVLHSWQSYSESMKNVVEDQDVAGDIKKTKTSIQLVYGDIESSTVLTNALPLKNIRSGVSMTILPGSHQIPLEHPETIEKIISS